MTPGFNPATGRFLHSPTAIKECGRAMPAIGDGLRTRSFVQAASKGKRGSDPLRDSAASEPLAAGESACRIEEADEAESGPRHSNSQLDELRPQSSRVRESGRDAFGIPSMN